MITFLLFEQLAIMYSKNVALIFALTLTTFTQASPVQITTREQESGNSVVARDPKFKLSSILKGAASLAGIALPLLGGVAAQSVDIEVPSNTTNSTLLSPNITSLSSANLKSLETRDPKFKFSSILKGAASLAGIALPLIGSIGAQSTQSADIQVPTNATNSTLLGPNITSLGSANLKSLDARDPKFKFSSILKGAASLAGVALPLLGLGTSTQSTQSVNTEAPSTNGTKTNTTLSAALTPFVARRSEEATFLLTAFRDDIVLANPVTVSSPAIGSTASISLECGNVLVTLLQQEAFACNFGLPSDMPAGTLTGQNPGQALSFEVSGDCVGVEFNVINTCADCVAPLTVDCHGTVDGSDNDVELCVSGSTLVEC